MPKANFKKYQPKQVEIDRFIATRSGKKRIDIQGAKLVTVDKKNQTAVVRFPHPNNQDTAWALALIHCQEPLQIPIPYSIDEPTLEFKYKLQAQMENCLYLMIKEGWKIKVDFPKNLTSKYLKALAMYFYNISELCLKLKDISDYGYYYPSAAWWFSDIFREVFQDNLDAYLEERFSPIRAKKTENREAAFNLFWGLNDYIYNLRHPKNQHTPLIRNPYFEECEPHIFRLIETAAHQAVISGEFEEKYWQPFMKAVKALVELKQQKDYQRIYHDGDRNRYHLPGQKKATGSKNKRSQ